MFIDQYPRLKGLFMEVSEFQGKFYQWENYIL